MFRVLAIALFFLAVIIQPVISSTRDTDIIIENIILNYDSVLYDNQRDGSMPQQYLLGHRERNLLFQCSEPADGALFSFYLEGNDNNWTSWYENPVKEYTNLSPGIYTLKVRAMIPGEGFEEYLIAGFRIKPPFYLARVSLVIYAFIIFLVVFYLIRMFVLRQKSKQSQLEEIIRERTEELMNEKEKTDTLLANLLPRDTADELMSKGKATKQKYNFVTVLFSDIQGFTTIAEEVNPEVLIDELDNFFFHFDSVVEKYNIEKIKTIGDAYMCAGGIPHRNRTNPIEVVLAAIEMQEYMNRMKKDQTRRGIKFWDIRVGIHTGTVIAGVVGQKKLSYDIWGDTVNTASRMESSGMPGKINISGVTYEYVKEFFICEYRGKMPVKYKGDLDMYFVNGIRPELRSETKTEPNKVFLNRLLSLKIQDLEDYYFRWYEENVPDEFVFHNIKFIKNICTQTELLATAEHLDEEKILALRIAALFVKSGLLKDYNDPVEYSMGKLEEMAPGFGFPESQVKHAGLIIRDLYNGKTGMKEVRILHDAIYDYSSNVDYPQLTELRYREENHLLGPLDKEKWYRAELERVEHHKFFTDTAGMLSTYTGEQQAERLRDYNKHIE